MAQEEAARIAKQLADLDAKSKAMTEERSHLNDDHDTALARIEDARADLKEQRNIARVHGRSEHDVVDVPASVVHFGEVDPDDIPVIDGSEREVVNMNCGVGAGCMSPEEDEADEEKVQEPDRERAASPLAMLGFEL